MKKRDTMREYQAMDRYQIKCCTCLRQWTEQESWNDLAATHTCRMAYLIAHPSSGGTPAGSVCAPGNHYVIRRIKGHYNPDRACDARCTGAKGATCDCSCGGTNHGADQV